MQTWKDLGDGRQKLTITSDEPGVPSSVYTGTFQEIASMLANSQGNANRRIAELRREPNGHATQPQAVPLTPEQRMQTVSDLSNPATVDVGILRVVESQTGPLSEIRAQQAEERNSALADAAAKEFASDEPEWFPSRHNINAMVAYIKTMTGGDAGLTVRGNYDRAFAELTDLGLLQKRPGEGDLPSASEESDLEPNVPAPKAVVPRTPDRISTGITSRDISGVPPRPNSTRLKYSREQLINMGPEEYKHLMFSDGAELLRCEQWYTTHPVKRMA